MDNQEVREQFPKFNFNSIKGRLSQLESGGFLNVIREKRKGKRLKKWYSYNANEVWRKILKIGASCRGKFKMLFAVTFEANEEPRETELFSRLSSDFRECDFLNLDNRGMLIKMKNGKFVEFVDFGYAQDVWDGDFEADETWKKIRTGEE